MPYASDKQKRLMQAVANNPAFAKRVGIPQSVGQKFEAHKAKGGEVMAKKLFGGKETYAEELKEAKAIKSGRISPQQYARGEQKEEAGMKMKRKFADGGAPGQFITAAPKTGSMTAGDMAPVAAGYSRAAPALNAQSARSMVGARPTVGARMSKGGSVGKMGAVKTAAPSRDGIASKGKTKGKVITMKRGGKC